jgi:DNA-binding NtrC family response regulator
VQGRELDAVLIDHWAPGAATALIADCHALRPELPILMLTANDSVAQAVAAMRAGATDFLVKPLAPSACSALEGGGRRADQRRASPADRENPRAARL